MHGSESLGWGGGGVVGSLARYPSSALFSLYSGVSLLKPSIRNNATSTTSLMS